MSSRLQQALHEGLSQGCLDERLKYLGDYTIETREDAEAVCEAVRCLPPPGMRRSCGCSPVASVLNLFECVADDASPAAQVFYQQGLPELIRLLARLDTRCDGDAWDSLVTLKVLAAYGTREGAEQVLQAALRPLDEESFFWTAVMGQFTADHPQTPFLFRELSKTLPVGFIGVALLDCANAAALEGAPLAHPFNSTMGRRRLHDWLTDSDPEHHSYALSAAAALPFIDAPHRDQLLALAFEHQDRSVQMEASWASAKLGSPAGLKCLARYCLDRNRALVALRYLEELGHADLAPPECLEPDFQAVAIMCDWLAHPNEFGRPPDHIELWDRRRFYWPPSDKVEELWLFLYRYDDESGDEQEAFTGVGLSGPTPWSFGEQHDEQLAPADYYALHCCWELQVNADPRAPEQRSLECGHALIKHHNPCWPAASF